MAGIGSIALQGNSDVEGYVHQLINPATRENALLELSKKRENFPELAPYLWYSFGAIAALLQEIVSIYPLLSPPALTAHASNRVCNALALLQCVASHNETRSLFLQGGRANFAASCAQLLPLDCTTWTRCVLVRAQQHLLEVLHNAGLFAAHIPLFLYPFLNTMSKTRPFEYLRLTSLGVIGALVKVRAVARARPGPWNWVVCSPGNCRG